MAPDINGSRGRRLEQQDTTVPNQQDQPQKQRQETTRMVERTKSAPLQDLATKATPRFPKNTSRSLSPKPRFPGNPSRSRSQPPRRERKQNAKRAAKESLLDSASQLAPDDSLSPETKQGGGEELKKTPKSALRYTKSEIGEEAAKRAPKSPLRYSKSAVTADSIRDKPLGNPLRASTGTPSNVKTPNSPKDASKSPSRRGRKETVGGNRSTSKMPAISPLHMEDEDANKASTTNSSSTNRSRSPKTRKEAFSRGGNKSASKLPTINLDEEDTNKGKSPRSRKKETVGASANKSNSKLPVIDLEEDKKGSTGTLDEDDSIDSNEKPQDEVGEADHWVDIPPPNQDRHRSEKYSPQSKPKDVMPTHSKNDNLPDLPTLTPTGQGGGTTTAKPGAFKTPLDNSISSRPKSPQRKGSKEAIKNGNSSSSRLPQLSPLHQDDDNTEGNNAAWDPFDTTSGDPFRTQPKAAETAADGPKRIPPKQRSRGGRKPGANNGQPAAASPFKRSTTGEDLGKRSNHGASSSAAAASFRRSHTLNGERPRVERGQKPDNASAAAIATGRKPSIAPPRHHKPPNALRGRAESILNHPLLSPGSHNQLDMSISQSEATHNDGSQVAPNHQRRRGLDQDTSNRAASPSAELLEVSRNSVSSQKSGRRSLSGRRGRSSVPAGQEDKDRRRMRKTRSSPEGSLERSGYSSKSGGASPDNKRNQKWTSEPRNAGRSRDPVNARRARSRQRPEEMANTDVGVAEVARWKESVKIANGDQRQAQSHSPARPRGRPAGASFPQNGSRSISPSRGRGRGASPTPGSKHRRIEPSRGRSASPSSSRHRRTAGGAPSGSRHKRSVSPSRIAEGGSSPSGQRESSLRGGRSSPGNSQRNLGRPRSSSSQRDLRKAREASNEHRPSLLSNVLDKANSKRNDGHESDSSASNQSDAIKTVVQFDPTKSASVSSYKPSSNDPSLNNSGVFRMENLKDKEELEDGSGGNNSGYLPGNMSVSQPKVSSPQGEGRRRRQSEQRRQSARNNRRSPRDGRRVRGGRGDGNPRESLRRTQSLTMNEVFDDGSRSESCLVDDNDGSRTQQEHRDSVASQNSAATFSGHESDRSRRGRGSRGHQRARLRQRLREKEQLKQNRERSEDDESEEEAPYLPARMAKSLSPPRSAIGDQAKGAHQSQEPSANDDDNDYEEDDIPAERNSTFSFVKQQLKNQKNQIKNEVNVLTNRVRGLGLSGSSQGSSSFNLDSESDSGDPYNKKPVSRGDSKGSVGKKLRGLFTSKSKKHAQLLGGESDSDYSAGVF